MSPNAPARGAGTAGTCAPAGAKRTWKRHAFNDGGVAREPAGTCWRCGVSKRAAQVVRVSRGTLHALYSFCDHEAKMRDGVPADMEAALAEAGRVLYG